MCTKIRDGCSEIWAEAENHEIEDGTPMMSDGCSIVRFDSSINDCGKYTVCLRNGS